jgi:hypothetical protein
MADTKAVRMVGNTHDLGYCDGMGCLHKQRCKVLSQSYRHNGPQSRRLPQLLVEIEESGACTIRCRSYGTGKFRTGPGRNQNKKKTRQAK